MTKEQEILKLTEEKRVAYDYQARRHEQWTENYKLLRDFIETNRLTQRQAINFPIMKTSMNSWMANVDDAPSLEFISLGFGELAEKRERVINEKWNHVYEKLNFEDMDVLDKKNVFLYGRTFKLLNWANGEFSAHVLDPWDIVLDPKTNPMDIQTARFGTRMHIYRSLREILANEKYDNEAKNELKTILDETTEGGIIPIKVMAENKKAAESKQERLKAMGVDNFDQFGATDVVIELNEHYTLVWEEKEKKFVKYVKVTAVGAFNAPVVVLYSKRVKDIVGIDKWPLNTWAEDLELTDLWPDGKADTIRTPNKVLNIFLSQLIENRTLRNYGMYYYDSRSTNFVPTAWEPKPFGMYPVPGKPSEIMEQINIPDLSEAVDEMQYIKGLIEEATAQTALEKGIDTNKDRTLGETEILFAKSRKINSGSAKFYRKSWKQFGEMWYEIEDANAGKGSPLELFKESTSGNGRLFKRTITSKDWKSEAGYKVKVRSKSEQDEEDTQEINKWIGIKNQFPNNIRLQNLAQKNILELADVDKDDIDSVMDAEVENNNGLPGGLSMTPPVPQALPAPAPK